MTLKLVARHAAIWNTDVFNSGVETPERKINVIENHCDTVRRDSEEVENSWNGHIICIRDEERFDRLFDLMLPIQFEEEYTDQPDIETETDACDYFIMGTPEEFVEAIEQRVDAGVMKS